MSPFALSETGRLNPGARLLVSKAIVGHQLSSWREPQIPRDYVTKSWTPASYMVCRYCGLGASVPHARVRECIDALQREEERLKERLHLRPVDAAAVSGRAPDRDNAGVMRLGSVSFGKAKPRRR
jgi:hypothetical protein